MSRWRQAHPTTVPKAGAKVVSQFVVRVCKYSINIEAGAYAWWRFIRSMTLTALVLYKCKEIVPILDARKTKQVNVVIFLTRWHRGAAFARRSSVASLTHTITWPCLICSKFKRQIPKRLQWRQENSNVSQRCIQNDANLDTYTIQPKLTKPK